MLPSEDSLDVTAPLAVGPADPAEERSWPSSPRPGGAEPPSGEDVSLVTDQVPWPDERSARTGDEPPIALDGSFFDEPSFAGWDGRSPSPSAGVHEEVPAEAGVPAELAIDGGRAEAVPAADAGTEPCERPPGRGVATSPDDPTLEAGGGDGSDEATERTAGQWPEVDRLAAGPGPGPAIAADAFDAEEPTTRADVVDDEERPRDEPAVQPDHVPAADGFDADEPTMRADPDEPVASRSGAPGSDADSGPAGEASRSDDPTGPLPELAGPGRAFALGTDEDSGSDVSLDPDDADADAAVVSARPRVEGPWVASLRDEVLPWPVAILGLTEVLPGEWSPPAGHSLSSPMPAGSGTFEHEELDLDVVPDAPAQGPATAPPASEAPPAGPPPRLSPALSGAATLAAPLPPLVPGQVDARSSRPGAPEPEGPVAAPAPDLPGTSLLDSPVSADVEADSVALAASAEDWLRGIDEDGEASVGYEVEIVPSVTMEDSVPRDVERDADLPTQLTSKVELERALALLEGTEQPIEPGEEAPTSWSAEQPVAEEGGGAVALGEAPLRPPVEEDDVTQIRDLAGVPAMPRTGGSPPAHAAPLSGTALAEGPEASAAPAGVPHAPASGVTAPAVVTLDPTQDDDAEGELDLDDLELDPDELELDASRPGGGFRPEPAEAHAPGGLEPAEVVRRWEPPGDGGLAGGTPREPDPVPSSPTVAAVLSTVRAALRAGAGAKAAGVVRLDLTDPGSGGAALGGTTIWLDLADPGATEGRPECSGTPADRASRVTDAPRRDGRPGPDVEVRLDLGKAPPQLDRATEGVAVGSPDALRSWPGRSLSDGDSFTDLVALAALREVAGRAGEESGPREPEPRSGEDWLDEAGRAAGQDDEAPMSPYYRDTMPLAAPTPPVAHPPRAGAGGEKPGPGKRRRRRKKK